MLPQRYIKNPDGKPSGVPAVPLGFGYNLHKIAGGSPKLCFSASNVHHRSKPWAGGLQSTAKVSGIP